MKKTDLKQIANDCGVNYQALNEQLKADGIDRKTATAKDVLECIFVNAPALMYCRQSGGGMVEYADSTICEKLIAAMRAVRYEGK